MTDAEPLPYSESDPTGLSKAISKPAAAAGKDGEPTRSSESRQVGEAGPRPIRARSEFHGALREALALAASQGCRELWLCDRTFADWPLGEVSVIDSLTAWAYGHRKLRLYAHDFDDVARRHPRFVAWRRHWSHIVESRQLDEIEAAHVPTVLLAPGLVTVRLADPVHYRGVISPLEADAVAARELLMSVSERSHEAFAATTLGL